MITLRKIQLLVVLTAVCVFSTTYGQQSDKPKRQLKFEVASGSIKIAEGFSEVTHLGFFHINKDRSIRQRWTDEWITLTSQWKQMSQKQQQFINKLQNDYQYRSSANKKNIGRPFSTKSRFISTPEGTVTYQVLGVSGEDVRKMAEAVIERLDNQAYSVLEENQKCLESNKNIIEEAEMILLKLETELKKLETQVDKKTKEYAKTNFEIDTTKRKEVLEHTKKNLEELARYMKLAKFELIGLHARINSIERFKASGKISDQGTLIKLDQMLITDQIEEAGVLARINAYNDSFKNTKELYDVIMRYNNAAAQKMDWEIKLTEAKNAKNDIEKFLVNPPKSTQPVQVHENKVFIWQVKQD